jgi:hypothetical protein
MRRFMVYFIEEGELDANEFALVTEYDANTNLRLYRFVNLDSDSILPEVFSAPTFALDWLDKNFESWVCIS